MATWPAYAKVAAADYGVREAQGVERTRFEDGAIRQARTATAAFTQRRIVAHIDSDADRIRFRGWAAANAHTWFTWADPDDGIKRRVRVVGGAGGIDYRAAIKTDGPARRWEARMELEGLWSDTVA